MVNTKSALFKQGTQPIPTKITTILLLHLEHEQKKTNEQTVPIMQSQLST
uniref:Uncharacterized protein n=1 Tax=Anguilla anguilla TaxID=7936 RepID=A0A0E9V7A2_ANGAN